MSKDANQRRESGPRTILVTGGAGFIGTNFIFDWLQSDLGPVINLDKMTYAGNRSNFQSDQISPSHILVVGDIGDQELVTMLLRKHRPCAIVNLAAESHVDRSIHGPADFVMTNVVGTFRLLEAAREYWNSLSGANKDAFRFVHVSTDEVYGSLSEEDRPCSELKRYAPNSPYAASKAASDHFMHAWHQTYGLPVVTVTCSNNYGPYQFPEKLIPLMIYNALNGNPLPVYGDGLHIRDWLYVKDSCAAIRQVLEQGRVGEKYNVGGQNEKTNLDVVGTLCDVLDAEKPRKDGRSYREQISFVADRPGHDRRYALDATKTERELGWKPLQEFEGGIRTTVRWYLDNLAWVQSVVGGPYRDWIRKNYNAR